MVKEFQPVLQFELILLEECSDPSAKECIAKAVLNAPISSGHVYGSRQNVMSRNDDAPMLMDYFDENDCLAFLQKAYGCHLVKEQDHLLLRWIDPEKRFIWDHFGLRVVEKYNYLVQLNRLDLWRTTVPVGTISRNLVDVERLVLSRATLVAGAGINEEREAQMLPPEKRMYTGTGKNPHLVLMLVNDLQHLAEVILSDRGRLWVHHTETMDLDQLPGTFPTITELEMGFTKLVYSPAQRQWGTVKTMMLKNDTNVYLHLLAKVFTQLTELVIVQCDVVLDTSEFRVTWSTLETLVLQHSSLEMRDDQRVEDVQTEELLRKLCPHAELFIYTYQVKCNSQVFCSGYLLQARRFKNPFATRFRYINLCSRL